MSDKPVYRYKLFHDSVGWIFSTEQPKNADVYAEIEALYPAAAYEALQKENAELKEVNDSLHRSSQFTYENQKKSIADLKAENAAQAEQIAELEEEKYVRDLVVISLNQVVDMRVDSLEQYLHATALNKKFIAEIESLRKQIEMLLGSARKTVLALAHVSIHDPLYTAAYDELSESIKLASKNGE